MRKQTQNIDWLFVRSLMKCADPLAGGCPVVGAPLVYPSSRNRGRYPMLSCNLESRSPECRSTLNPFCPVI
jgi:hypothetical protein